MKNVYIKRVIVIILTLGMMLLGFPSAAFAAAKIPELHEITSQDTDLQNPGGVQNDLTWSHQLTGNFQFYRVYRRIDDESSSFELIATEIGVKSYTDEEVEPDTAYEYYVSANFENPGSNPNWEEVVSNIQSIITSTEDTDEVDDVVLASVVTSDQEPSNPGGVQNELTWTHERGLTFNQYEVYRKNLDILDGFLLLSDSVDAESYTDESAVPGVLYEYYVLAVYPGDVVVESNHEICDTQLDDVLAIFLLSVDTSDIDPLFVNGVQNHLIWEHSEEGPQFQHYEVNRDDLEDDPDLGFEELSSNTIEKFYTDDTAVPGVEYEYYISAVYNDGNGDIKMDSNHLTVTTALDKISSVLLHDIVSSDIDLGELSGVENYLNWEHEEELEFQYYELWRDNLEDDPHIGFVHLNRNLNDKFYTDTDVVPEVDYEYYVLAVYPDNVEIESNYQIITTVADTAGLTVEFSPVNGSVDVAVNENITITFNKDVRNIDNSAITDNDLANMLSLKKDNADGADVEYSATITGKTLITINPDAVLDYSQVYYAAIAAVVEDKDNNVITATKSIFTTGAEPDLIAPTAMFDPQHEEIDVAPDRIITITFDEMVTDLSGNKLVDIDVSALEGMLALRLTDSTGDPVDFSASVTSSAVEIPVIVITPDEDLYVDNVYYVEISGSVKDLSDNVIELSFAEFTVADKVAPTITFIPHDGATGVAVNTMITIKFDEPIKEGYDLNSSGELLSLQRNNPSGSSVPFTASINTERTIITMDPTPSLSNGSDYYVAIGEVEDDYGNVNTGDNATFRTASSSGSSSSGGSGTTVDAGPSETYIIEDELTPLGAVEYLNAYVKGYPDKTFRSKKSMTRAELSVIFVRILGLDLSNPGPQMFSDVNRNDWHYNYIQVLAKVGILKGNDDGTFEPNKAITHAEAAEIIAEYWEYFGIEVSDKDSGLKDIEGNWAEKSINKLVNAGITEGFGNNSFFPSHMTTRGQMVQMINRLIGRAMIEVEVPTYKDVDRDYEVFDDIESASYRGLMNSQ